MTEPEDPRDTEPRTSSATATGPAAPGFAAPLGCIGEFRPEQERFSVYVERFELFLAANGVPDARKVPLFLTVLGGTTYALLHNLVAPNNPKTVSYQDLVTTLRSHFEPKPLVIAQRFHFHRRDQQPGESITSYLAELRRLAAQCNFRGEQLTEALRDRVVCGLSNQATQKRLLSEPDLSLEKVMEIAQSMEAADANARALQKPPEPVALVDRGASTPKKYDAGDNTCYRCGRTGHSPRACGFKDATCHSCGKRGHIRRACRGRRRPAGVQNVEEQQAEDDAAIKIVKSKTSGPYQVWLSLNGQSVAMEVDTGAAVSLMSETMWLQLSPRESLVESPVQLRTYTAQPIRVLGQALVEVNYQTYQGKHTLTIVGGDGPALIGRDWLQHIRLDWANVYSLAVDTPIPRLAKLLDNYGEVFQEGIGTMTQITARPSLKEGAVPQFRRPYTVPFAIRESVERELDRLEAEGTLRKVEFSDWAAPIVVVPKKDGKIRICGDYKSSINPALQVDKYPLPNMEDLLASLAGGKRFTKLDLTAAYQQMPLDEPSSKLTTISTQKGLFRFTRMPFGVSSAPAVFQRAMDTILQGLSNVICYLDDILVTGSTDEQHLQNLEQVLARLKAHGVRLKKDKCRFFQDLVEHLGQVVTSEGVHTSLAKVQAVVDQPAPVDVSRLRSFLGQINYYSKYIPNLSAILAPLYQLLRSGHPWHWSEECNRAFLVAKEKVTRTPVLAHFDGTLPISLAADASSYGVGAVISHTMPDGKERPIAFASRMLSEAERKYAQVEKEALSLVFGVKKFHQYLYGRCFSLITDHKPLTAILGPKRGVPPLATARMQRWALLLSAYDYDIVYRPTTAHGNADGLSRLPLPEMKPVANTEDPTVFNIGQIEALPIQSSEIKKATCADKHLRKVMSYTLRGWPTRVPQVLSPYHTRRLELTVEGGCLLWGIRVVIPTTLRGAILEELHRSHPGVVRMKTLARSHVWWPSLDKDIEDCVKQCADCQSAHSAPAPLHPWAWPSQPWQRVHVDYAGPVVGKMLLVVVDAHSKWPEVIVGSSSSAAHTIQALRDLFARWGLPEQLVSDNGPQFTSDEFRAFTQSNGIKRIRTAPYHPATNGAAERFVQTVKRALLTGLRKGVLLEQCLSAFLLQYRNTPHATTGVSPGSLLVGRHLRTRLDLLRPPTVASRVRHQQERQKEGYDGQTQAKMLQVGQHVWARNYSQGPRWLRAVVETVNGSRSYLVRVAGDSRLWHRHLDQLRVASEPEPLSAGDNAQETPAVISDQTHAGGAGPQTEAPSLPRAREDPLLSELSRESPEAELNGEFAETTPDRSLEHSCSSPPPSVGSSHPSSPTPRYPTRSRRPPDRLMCVFHSLPSDSVKE